MGTVLLQWTDYKHEELIPKGFSDCHKDNVTHSITSQLIKKRKIYQITIVVTGVIIVLAILKTTMQIRIHIWWCIKMGGGKKKTDNLI